MKKLYVLIIISIMSGVLQPVFADVLNYKIKQEGTSMVIVPYYSQPQKPFSEVKIPPAKIPFYSEKNLPKGKNRNRSV